MVAQVIRFPSRAGLTASAEDTRTLDSPEILVTGVDADDDSRQLVASENQISIDQLYSDLQGVSAELNCAIRLLTAGEQRIQEGLSAFRGANAIAADDALQRFQSMLPELFCLRNLGDGFGMIVNALHYTFENLEGMPLNERQINAVLLAVKRLRSEPYLNVNIAAEALANLESVGLGIEPRELDVLADLLDG